MPQVSENTASTADMSWLDLVVQVQDGEEIEYLNAPQPAAVRRPGRMNELRAAINAGYRHKLLARVFPGERLPENLADMPAATMTRALTVADVQLARDAGADVRGAWSQLKDRVNFAHGRYCHSYLADYVRAVEAGKINDQTAAVVAEQAEQVKAHMEAIAAAVDPAYVTAMRGVTADPTTDWQAFCAARDGAEEQAGIPGYRTLAYYVVEMAHFYGACAVRLRRHERAKLQAHLDQLQAA